MDVVSQIGTVSGRSQVESSKIASVVGIVAGAVAIVVGIGGGIWHVATLDARVKQLEVQVHTLTVAPTLAATGAGSAGQPAIPNPVAQACADLARNAAQQIAAGGGGFITGGEIRRMMADLGCNAPPGK
jgi:hypothetical protein